MQVGWKNPFYQRLWKKAGIEPGDIKSLRHRQATDLHLGGRQGRPAGASAIRRADGISNFAEHLSHTPTKLVTSGGTTAKPRITLHGIAEWEWNALGRARALYSRRAAGRRGADPATCSLANLGWAMAKASQEYLGALALTTGSGVVTPSRRQIEIAFDVGTNCWSSFPEYMLRLAEVSREEFGRDVRELNTKLITTFLGPDLEGTLRAQLEELWGCPVYDNYGTNELGAGAFECQYRNGLHLMEDADLP